MNFVQHKRSRLTFSKQMKIISLLLFLKMWNLLLYNVSMIEEIKSKLQNDAQQWIFMLYNYLVFNSLSLIHFFIVQDVNVRCTRSEILVLQVQRKQINQLQMMMIFFTHQHHMTHQKIKRCMMSEFHSLSRDSFLRKLMSSTASYDINHLLRAYQDWLKLVNDLVKIWSRSDSVLTQIWLNTLFCHQHLVHLHHFLFMLQTHFFWV